MKSLPFFFAVLSLSTLTACRSSPPDNVEKINHLQIPLVLLGEKPPQAQISHIASLYQENKQQIDNLTRSVKSQYLQGTTAKEIFVSDSAVQRVYASLTKLEQLNMVNQQYLKDKNLTGLQNIHLILEPLLSS
ncbi:hypothetical protein [Enterobacter cloacae complex sp. P24RS]|uniref:hypothetical protein n=1 Tax=Enterobacter cloacae complex sp. P24RS TaxID=2779568 RepID=UPI001875CCFF|nr:hypothetical protein [Enterobacter cloacae complex sp. P24RS]MBE4963753.1 hypothetical protein [Enterobacter cloacae complex sp. P24RS]